MPEEELRKLRECIVRLSIPNSRGTGFFVAPGTILTCAHVVEAAPEDDNKLVDVCWKEQNKKYTAKILREDSVLDIALLEIINKEEIPSHPCIYLDKSESEPEIGQDLYSYGFTEDYPDGDSASFKYEGISNQDKYQLLKLKAGQIKFGLSGAPLLNLRTDSVCGVINLSRNPNDDIGGRAIPMTTILLQFQDLEIYQRQAYKKFCPICGFKNERRKKFCRNCGNKLIKSTWRFVIVKCSNPNCGIEVSETDYFCEDCGKSIKNNNEHDASASIALKKSSKKFEKSKNIIEKGDKVIEIDGSRSAFEAYIEGIKSTKHQLYVTSFLDSQFWRYKEPLGVDIINANKELSDRINANDNGCAQRLFIIDRPLQKYISQLVKVVNWHKREEKDETKIAQLEQSIINLENLSKYFEMRIIEKDALKRSGIKEIDFVKYEYALYDNFRLDMFNIDNNKNIISVEIYPKNCKHFEVLKEQFLENFRFAWNRSQSQIKTINDFLEEIKHQMEIEKNKIDYRINRLLEFKNIVYNIDKYPFLKYEQDKVVKILKDKLNTEQKSEFNRYLDIGVFTARYPSLLIKEGLINENKIFAIDNEVSVECIMKLCNPNIHFVLADIRFKDQLTKIFRYKYDLITCMLGTASHFGLRKNFNEGICNMLRLLDIGGFLVISVWSKKAIENKDLLVYGSDNFYKSDEIDWLIDNNPDKETINQTLEIIEEKLNIKSSIKIYEKTDKLDIYFIEKMAA